MLWCADAGAEPAAAYTVAVVPQFTPMATYRAWTPFLERLTRDTGVHFELQVAQSIPMFEAAVLAGGPDFAFLSPYHEVVAKRAQGYIPLVRDRTPLTGILVVRRDGPIGSAKELDGRKIAFPAVDALGSSVWLRALLAEKEGIRFTPLYVTTHSNVYRHVLLGKADAGGGTNNTLALESVEIRTHLRVLLETAGVAPHPLSANPRVPARVREAVAAAILKMAQDPGAGTLLARVQMPRPMAADYARDYQPLEQYRLEHYLADAPKP